MGGTTRLKLVAQSPRLRPACFVLITAVTGLTGYPLLEDWICLGAGSQAGSSIATPDTRVTSLATCDIARTYAGTKERPNYLGVSDPMILTPKTFYQEQS